MKFGQKHVQFRKSSNFFNFDKRGTYGKQSTTEQIHTKFHGFSSKNVVRSEIWKMTKIITFPDVADFDPWHWNVNHIN